MKGFKKKVLSALLTLAMVVGMLQPMAVEAAETTNVALGKTVTTNAPFTNSTMTLDKIVDGDISEGNSNNNYGEFGADSKGGTAGNYYVQIDLADVYDISEVELYRYYGDSRTYDATVIALATTEDEFNAEDAHIVYNSDTDNVHGFGNGTDAKYSETGSGKSWEFDAVAAQYVRIYMCGVQSGGKNNHIVECKVYGVTQEEPDQGGEDGDTDETPTPIDTAKMTVSESGCAEGAKENVLDNDKTTFWRSESLANGGNTTTISKGSPYLQIQLDGIYEITQVDYTPRWDGTAKWQCTGNIQNVVVEVSEDGSTWTEASMDVSEKITAGVETDFPVALTFANVRAQYIRVSGTKSYHWDTTGKDNSGVAQTNTTISIGELDVYGTYLEDAPTPAVDRTALEEAKTTAQNLKESDYTAESWATLAAALVKANALAEDADQTTVDTAAKAITDAIADLEIAEEDGDSEVTYEYTNVALNKNVTAALNAGQIGTLQIGADSNDRPLTMAVDGTINTNNYADIAIKNNGSEIKGSAYVQVDLGQVYDVDKVNLYRYWYDSRTYDATVVVLAETEAAFGTDAQKIVYNSDTDNVHGLGAGTDKKYAESSAGREWTFDAFSAQFIRVYVNGNNNKTANTNHIVELQAWANAEVLPEPEPALKNAETYLDFPTHYQDRDSNKNSDGTLKHVGGQVVHPDVVYVENGWNGYKYWAVYTPNTMVTSQYENPYIAASNDGKTWVEPEGISNPIEPEPISTRYHNCDADMIYNKEMDAMMAYWNWADDNGNLGAEVRVRISYDGIHWGVPSTYDENTGIWTKPADDSEKTLKPATKDSDGIDNSFITAIASKDRYDMLSPTFTYDSYRDIYVMWANNAGNVGYNNGQNNKVQTRWSEDGLNWSDPVDVNNFLDKTTAGLSLAPWHQDVNYIPELKEYWALSQCFTGNNPDGSMLYLTTSKDGINWQQVGTDAVMNPGEPGSWDDFQIYRTCFVYDNDTLKVWYSSLQQNTANQLIIDSAGNYTITAGPDDTRIWRIGYTENTYEGIMTALTGDGKKPALVTGTALNLTADKTELKVGDEGQVSVAFTPAETSDQIVKYTSSNEEVLTVSPFGVVTAVGEGTATITAETQDNISDTVEIIVGEAETPVVPEGVEWYDVPFDGGDIIYDEGWNADSLGQYSYTQGAKATLVFYGTGVKWVGQKDTNFGEAIVTVDGNETVVSTYGGAVTGVEHFVLEGLTEGVHTITIEPKNAGVVNNSGCIDIEKLVVQYDKIWDIDVSSVVASASAETIRVGKTAAITANVQPFNANDKTVKFESSNESIAKVNASGIVTGVAAGEVTIKVIADGAETSVKITVKDSSSTAKRLTINNENPLLIVPIYGQSYNAVESEMQWGDTLVGRWNSLPADIRDNCVIVLHAGRIANGSLKAFYTQQLEIAEENDIPVMIVTATAGLYPQWTATTDVAYDDEWLTNAIQTYDSLKGFVVTENYWTDHDRVATEAADHLRIAAENGGYVIWFEHQTHVIENILQNSAFKDALAEYSDNFAFTWKNTPAGANQNAETAAYMQGLWLAGVIDQWGGLMDTWKWYEKSYGKLFEGTVSYIGTSQDSDGEECRAVVMEPEALLGIEMLSIYANGGTIYSFEHPAYTQGINDKNTPLFENVIYETFKYILDNPAPSKEEVLEDTAVVIHGNLSADTDLHTGVTSDDQTLPAHSSGRYGLLPAVPAAVSTGNIPDDKIVDLSAISAMSINEKKAYLDELYTEGAYEGDAFAQYVDGTWFVYNSKTNEDVDQSATVSVNDQSVKVDVEPHTFAIMKTESEGEISVYLNNYRVNKDEIWDNYTSSTIKWDPDVNTIMQEWLADNYMSDPVDGADTYRTTTFTLTDLDAEPTVNIIREKENDFTIDVDYDEAVGTATITVTANGYVYFTIADGTETPDPTPEVDKTALNAAISNTKKLDKDDYTSSSWKALEKALEAAKAVSNDDNATQGEVDKAALALNAAIAGLEPAGPTTIVLTKDSKGSSSSSTSSTAANSTVASSSAVGTTPTSTGDSANIGLMIALLGVSVVALFGVISKKRRA